MNFLFGRYECKLDAKNRMRLPSRLLEQFGERENLEIVVNYGFENALMLFPIAHFNAITAEVNKLNDNILANRNYKRQFFGGLDKLKVDSADRILLSKDFQQYAKMEGDVLITPMGDYFEMWNPKIRENHVPSEAKERSDLAEEVMGGDTVGYTSGGAAPGGV